MRGEPPPPTLKVGLNTLGGFRNEMTFVLTGHDIAAEGARWCSSSSPTSTPPGRSRAPITPTRPCQEEAAALLHCVVRGPDPKAIGRAFSGAAIELALSSYPGFHVTAPPGDASPYGVFSAAYVEAAHVPHVAVHADGTRVDIAPPRTSRELEPIAERSCRRAGAGRRSRCRSARSPARAAATRAATPTSASGCARTSTGRGWCNMLTVEHVPAPAARDAPLRVTRHVLPNLRALNFVVEGMLGEGVASNARHDPQAKALGEWLGSRKVDVPVALAVS